MIPARRVPRHAAAFLAAGLLEVALISLFARAPAATTKFSTGPFLKVVVTYDQGRFYHRGPYPARPASTHRAVILSGMYAYPWLRVWRSDGHDHG